MSNLVSQTIFLKNAYNEKLKKRFKNAQKEVKELTKRPSDEELLELYALFKQGKIGDNEKEKPSFWNVKGCRKWDAWNNKKGLSKEAAMNNYIKHVENLKILYK